MNTFFGFEASGGLTGEQVMERLSALHEADIQRRKRDIQALAEITALSILGNLLRGPLVENLKTLDTKMEQEFRNAFWLRDILQTVQSDKDKLTLVDNYLKQNFSNLRTSNLDSLRKWFKKEVEEESKQIRLLRQAFYYRNRSVNAIIAFLNTKENSDFKNKELNTSEEVVRWFSEARIKFLLHGKGEKFTRNSYVSEWEAFLQDVLPELPIVYESDEEKSLNHKFKIAVQSKAQKVDKSAQSNRTKRLLKKYSEGTANSNQVITDFSVSKELPSIEMKVRKGVGIFATLLFSNANLDSLLSLSSEILLKSLTENTLPGISTEIVKGKNPALVVKCECEPNAHILRLFENFISQVLEQY